MARMLITQFLESIIDATGLISMLELLSTLFFILICADLIFGGLSGRSRRPPGDEPGDDI